MPSQINHTVEPHLAKEETSRKQVTSRSQERRLKTLHHKRHTLILDEGQNTALCACNGWELADRQNPLSLIQAKRQHDLHIEMTGHKEEKVNTIEAPSRRLDADWISTFPEQFTTLVDKFVKQAQAHPAFVGLSTSEIRLSVRNRLFSIVKKAPWWFGRLKMDRKREATEAQLAALTKAREARERLNEDEAVREQRISKRVESITSA